MNKSDFELDLNDLRLLHHGLGFVPTPKWTGRVERKEWENLFQHIRRVEWKDFFGSLDGATEGEEEVEIPKKLKIPKFSRPDTQVLNTEVNTYVEMVTNKLRNIKSKVDNNYKTKNNINYNLRNSLKKIIGLVKQKKIVVCRSDKDGKIIVCNYEDYMSIIEKELRKYEIIKERARMENFLKETKEKAEKIVLKMFESGDIDEKILYITTGYKRNINSQMRKITGPQAKYFSNSQTGYVYPLFKTHKVDKENLSTYSINQIPTRLVQATGNAYLSRITSFIEEILKPISVRYCKTKVNEYCKDSQHYLKELMKWKNEDDGKNTSTNYKIIAVDVKALYPSIPRNLLEIAIKDALDNCSTLTENGKENLITLTNLCIDNNFTKFQDKFYKQRTGIITGDNNSVSLANISLHYIIKNVDEIKEKTEIFKRFIDDILYITEENENSEKINNGLIREFAKHGLELTFREMSTSKKQDKVEFLDVLHCTNKKSTRKFITKNFTKPTAINSTFINGRSFHPTHIFKGIIFGEAKRLRRLNETDEGYKKSLEELREKCVRSEFREIIVDEVLEVVKDYKTRWKDDSITTKCEEKKEKRNKEMQVWSTSLKGIISLNKKEKDLIPNAQIVYARPPTLANMITNYKQFTIKETKNKTTTKTGSRKCGKCGLCGNFGKLENMVKEGNTIERKDGKRFRIEESLNCKDHGIYVAKCKICQEVYVGQTINKFSVRWNGHRAEWKEMMTKKEGARREKSGDGYALYLHYKTQHRGIMDKIERNGMEMWRAYEVMFVERKEGTALNTAENFWISKLKAKINISRTYLPYYK